MKVQSPARHLLSVVLAAVALALALGEPAAAEPWDSYRVGDAKATLKRINSLRASFGAPRVTEVPEWSTGCAQHAAYMATHGLSHAQDPTAADYTPDGAQAALMSVLSVPASEPFGPDAPLGLWAESPHHQATVLDPRLRRTGFARGCMNTLSGLKRSVLVRKAGQRPVRPRLLAWPGDGAKAVPRVLSACLESPNAFLDAGYGCEGVGTALYVYALDPKTGGCRWSEDGARPRVRVKTQGRSLPVSVVPSTACGWIAVTGQPLPADASVRMDVTFARTKLTHRFSTGVS